MVATGLASWSDPSQPVQHINHLPQAAVIAAVEVECDARQFLSVVVVGNGSRFPSIPWFYRERIIRVLSKARVARRARRWRSGKKFYHCLLRGLGAAFFAD